MIIRFLLIVCLINSPIILFSQSELSITGKIVDSENTPLPYVTIQGYDADENKIIKGDFSDEGGDFNLLLPEGNYFLIFRYSGLTADTIHLAQKSGEINLGTIKMLPVSELSEIEIVAQKSIMEYQLDKRVFNVDADLNNQGTNAVEVLENIPSITVDAEGNISLRGNPNVRVLIDGKMSGFTTNVDALQQLRSENIERIEVITNASSRYDAQGESGIINIVLKKNQTKGLNGSVGIRGGYFPELGGDFRLNYRKDKINFFVSYSINKNSRPGYSTTYQRLNSADTSFTYRQLYEHTRTKMSHHGSAGVDFYLNERNSLSTSFTIRSGLGNNSYDRYYENMNPNDVIIGFNDRYEAQTELEDLFEAGLSYSKKIKQKGEWNTDFKWFRDQDIEKSDYTETASGFLGEKLENSRVSTIENNFLAQTDFILPYAKDGKVETGLRTQFRNMENDFQFGALNGSHWEYPVEYNDTYNYNENVYAAYAMTSKTWKKFSIQGGLRGEYTDITTLQISSDQQIKKKYFDLFPSAAVSFKNNTKQTFQISYSRRISRPRQWDLMPFTKFGDNKERRIGNAQINPEYTNSLEAGILQLWSSGSFLGSVYYRNTTDKIERISELGNDGIIYIKPMNIGLRDAYGVELNATYNPINWIRLNSGFNFYQEIISGEYNNIKFRRENFTWTNRTSINLSFPKIIRAQITFNYTAPSIRPQGKTLAIYHFDFGLSRELLKGTATIGLNIRDLFNTRRWKDITDTPQQYAESNTLWRPRTITLVFTYRFNQQRKETDKTDFNLLEDKGE
jgi:outer membrane cobalamin receptor